LRRSLRLVKELIGSGVSGVVQEAALRWYLYSLHQSVPDALASLPSEAGLRKPGALLSGTTRASLSEELFRERWEEVLELLEKAKEVVYKRLPRQAPWGCEDSAGNS
jgi:hypothetical protein